MNCNLRHTSWIIVLMLFSSLIAICQTEKPLNTTQTLKSSWKVYSEKFVHREETNLPISIHEHLLALGINSNRYFQDSFEISRINQKWILEHSLPERDSTFNWELELEQVDIYGDVFLNSKLRLSINNYFNKYLIPIKPEDSLLKISLGNHEDFEKSAKEDLSYSLPGGPRAFTRRPAFLYGWDWAQKVSDKGIHSVPKLVKWQKAVVREVSINTKEIKSNIAEMLLKLIIESDQSREVQLTFNEKRRTVFCKKGVQAIELEFEIENPKFWWCNGRGEPHLYTTTLELSSEGKLLQRQEIKYGVRTAELITQENGTSNFYIQLNGEKVFCKGANWVPSDIFLNNVDSSEYIKLIETAVESNFNMLRVWGGGRYERDIFYELCDLNGIMVWQDFMFACAMYPWDQNFLNNVAEEAVMQVQRLRKHPSIVLWCGNNENAEGWERWGWKDQYNLEQQEDIAQGYEKLFVELLPEIVREHGAGLSYWESSPRWGRGDARFSSEGDAHDWGVWHDEMSFKRFDLRIPLFMSEFGFQSFPSINSLRKNDLLITGKINYPENIPDLLNKYQGHNRGFKLINNYSDSLFTNPTNIKEWIYLSQLTQAKGIAFGAWRHRMSDRCNGTLYWQFNDAWPCISWSGVDYYGDWKALQYDIKRVYSDLAVGARIKGKRIILELSNHSNKENELSVNLKQKTISGKHLNSIKTDLIIPRITDTIIVINDFKKFSRNKYLVINEANNKLDKQIEFGVLEKKLKLPKSNFSIQKSQQEKNCLEIEISALSFTKDVGIYCSNCEGKFSENFFDIEAGESKKVVFYSGNCDQEPKFEIFTLNEIINPRH